MTRLLWFLEGLRGTGAAQQEDWLKAIPRPPLRPGVVVTITDAFMPDGDLGALALALASQQHRVLVLHVLSPDEIEGRFEGDIELQDVETGRLSRVSIGPELRRRYTQGVDRWRSELADACRRRGAIYVPLSSGWSVEEILLHHLWRQEVLA